MKKNILIDHIRLNREVISVLDDTPMLLVYDTNLPESEQRPITKGAACRSGEKTTDCYFSRHNVTQCRQISFQDVTGTGERIC